MQQTTITDENRQDFYNLVYKQSRHNITPLIDISMHDLPIMVDCLGKHYEEHFNKKVYKLETLTSVKNFKLPIDYFDRLIDDQKEQDIGWPEVKLNKSVLIFDRSPLLKYRSVDDLHKILTQTSNKYTPTKIILRLNLTFIDDNRFDNRIKNLSQLELDRYRIEKFSYDVKNDLLYIEYENTN
jgi:hypothetical protein